MEQYKITGMSCAACSSRIEKAVSSLPNVESCSVSLLTNSMVVEGSENPQNIIKAVENAGYGASKKGISKVSEAEEFSDTETPRLKKRLIYSLGFLIVLMYFSMGHMISLPLPHFFHNNYVAIGLVQLLLSIAVIVINKKFFISGFKGFINKSPNMDTLVALGSGASFIYSTYSLFMMTHFQTLGDFAKAGEYLHELYFESAAMILTLITVGKMLEAHSKGKTTNALKGLMKLKPKTAVVLIDGKEVTLPIEQLKKGDIFVVRPGENIPADAIVVKGESSVNESALTGESIPVDKTIGDSVWSATINQSGYMECEATKTGEDTTFSQIIKMVTDASLTKAPITKVADIVSGVFVPIVITLSVITFFAWLLLGETSGFAIARAVSVLVISCPCALGLATPVAIMVGSGVGAKNGILFKNATSIETSGKVKIVALDKTGTITLGKPKVTDVIPKNSSGYDELLSLAYSLEAQSEHPLSKAIIELGEEKNLSKHQVSEFKTYSGKGLSGIIKGELVIGGNLKFIKEYSDIFPDIQAKANELSNDGKTPLFFTKGNEFLGIIAVADVIKEDSKEAIESLKKMGLEVVMLTGDNELTAKAIASQVGIKQVVSGVMPGEKDEVILELSKKGKVCMVGDGINDAPALTRADVGIAIGKGADIAIDSADIVLVKNSLLDVAKAIKIGKKTLKNIYENLFWAFIYNIIGIPLAAGVWIYALGWKLNPMFAAGAMSLSSFCVVSNALRLNLLKLQTRKTEEIKMEKTLKIEGMMCPHCEARVKKCLEELDGVKNAEVSHKTGTAKVFLEKDIPDNLLKSTIEAQGYTVL